MASSLVPVVDIPDDDDDDVAAAAASPPSSRKRTLGTTSSAADFVDAFWPSPPAPKRGLLATSPIDLDDTPPPPKRRPSSPSKPPVLAVDDDDDGDTGLPTAPCSVVPGDDDADTPDSVLFRAAFSSESPRSGEPRSTCPDSAVAETPGFTSSRSVEPPAAFGWLPAAPVQKLSGVSSLISLDSDDESDDTMHNESLTKLPSNTAGTINCGQPLHADFLCENSTLPGAGVCTEKYSSREEAKKRQKEEKKKTQQEEKRLKKEEKAKLIEERKQKQQEMKAQLAEKKRKEKEIRKWESGKLALKCIAAEIHSSLKSCSIRGFKEKFKEDLSCQFTANSIEGSILWKMEIPDDIAQMISSLQDRCDIANRTSVSEVIPYIVIVLQAEEFCDLVSRGLFFNHVQKVRNAYPTFTICYVINELMSYINKREESQFENQSSLDSWRRPPVEKVLCKLATHYVNIHSRHCINEVEVAEHLVGLTASLAKCKFRKPLTWLSVHANGSIIPKDFIDKNLARKDAWFKSLIAIPKVSAKQAHAIWKQYRSMRSLLNVYMDPSKTDREKELLLSDLRTENQLGDDGRRVGEKCSTTVYRILMAQDGKMETDVAVAGANSSGR
ncbi:hypothetical protein ACP70R_010441 [Stipagrostis hirtigluma subsp. patula]